ncbi:serine/threonine protein kinase, CMGC, CDC2/CDK sub [Maudiozyma exigua]|uniref:Serine/threonine-protein kinase BUR1 n=1 Tax=Maudiozyma exigua TaxID=34358 RepID=A0A9P6WF44_MAUEX|nr:serine/threonine protein kinase, CMGC, CDC2/CDK sub [Kazachstania exigua]
MSLEPASPVARKYKIGKMKQTTTVVTDPKTGLQYIDLKERPEEKIYGVTKFANHYQVEKKLGQGTFGSVYLGSHLETQRQVAMKRILVNEENDLFPITAQREITILKKLNHKNIIKLIEMVYDVPPESQHGIDGTSDSNIPKNDSNGNNNNNSNNKFFYMILPYMVSDLAGILHNPRITLSMGEIKNIMLQLLEGINYIHCTKYMHRDIKTANILIDHNGTVKLADFGLARLYYGSPPNLKFPGSAGTGAKYTSVVVTRWYRAPELVLGEKYYTTAVDIWGIGCVLAEFFEKKPILQGTSDIDQGHVIFKLMGTPTEEEWKLARYLPGAQLTKTEYKSTLKERFGKYLNETGLRFLSKLLALDPYKRYTAMAAMKDDFFKEEPLPVEKLQLLCEESHESDIKRYKEEMHQNMSQRAPTAPRGHVNDTGVTNKSNYGMSQHSNKIPLGPKSHGSTRKTPNYPGSNKAPNNVIVLDDNVAVNKPSRYNNTKPINVPNEPSSLPARPNKSNTRQSISRYHNGNKESADNRNNGTRNVGRACGRYQQQNTTRYDNEAVAVDSISFNRRRYDNEPAPVSFDYVRHDKRASGESSHNSRYQNKNRSHNQNKEKYDTVEITRTLEIRGSNIMDKKQNPPNYKRRNSSHGNRYEKRKRDDYENDTDDKDISSLY